jgi:hypothetical protein
VNVTDSPEAEDAEFYRWYGAWAPLDPAGVAALMAGFERPWWLVGGWSIEAFTGVPREHEDVDLSFLSTDVPAFRAHVRDGWTPWSNQGGTIRPLSDRFPETFDAETQIWLRRDGSAPWAVDIPITPDRDGLWTSKRWSSHVAPVEDVTWRAADGIDYLRPEITLHFKARFLRPKDESDFAVTWPLLGEDRRAWLHEAITATEGPEHPWLARRL